MKFNVFKTFFEAGIAIDDEVWDRLMVLDGALNRYDVEVMI